MDQLFLMRIVQAPCKLNGDVQHSLERLGMPARIEPPVINPVFETAAFDVLSKDPRDTAERTYVVATDDMRMQAEVDPGFAFPGESLPLRVCLKPGGQWRFDRQVHAPATVVDAIDQPHPAAFVNVIDLIQVEDDVARMPEIRNLLWVALKGCSMLLGGRGHRMFQPVQRILAGLTCGQRQALA